LQQSFVGKTENYVKRAHMSSIAVLRSFAKEYGKMPFEARAQAELGSAYAMHLCNVEQSNAARYGKVQTRRISASESFHRRSQSTNIKKYIDAIVQ
jgi:hypothetical protein